MKKGIFVYHKEHGKGRVIGMDITNTLVNVRFSKEKRLFLPANELTIKKTRYFAPVKGAPEDTMLPTRGSKRSSGYDFYAPRDIVVPARGASELVFMNVKAYMRNDEFLYLKIRSGLSVKNDLWLACSGIIDSDYVDNPSNDGNIGVRWRNYGDEDYTIKKGDRCCQGIFIKFVTCEDDDFEGERTGGLGSTGK